VLGILQTTPAEEIAGDGQVRDGAIMPARLTEGVRAVRRNKPVADVVLGVAAEPISRIRRTEWAPKIALRNKSLERLLRCDIAEAMPATFTAAVLEVESLSAVLALEKLHGIS
jgi:hypothetical protein